MISVPSHPIMKHCPIALHITSGSCQQANSRLPSPPRMIPCHYSTSTSTSTSTGTLQWASQKENKEGGNLPVQILPLRVQSLLRCRLHLHLHVVPCERRRRRRRRSDFPLVRFLSILRCDLSLLSLFVTSAAHPTRSYPPPEPSLVDRWN